jgi:peptide chain release factor 2
MNIKSKLLNKIKKGQQVILLYKKYLKNIQNRDLLYKEDLYLSQLIALLEEKGEDDIQFLLEIDNELNQFFININNILKKNLLVEEYDSKSAYLEINAGSGGLDAQDCAEILVNMYYKWSQEKKFTIEEIDWIKGESIGIRNCTLKIIGLYAYGLLKVEQGIHRIIRKSPINSKRHTSFVSVTAYPVLQKSYSLNIAPQDIRIDTYRSSGAGGQHVNTTDSAVRITHLPTNISTQSQASRSQYQNKETALEQLVSKLEKYYKILEESKKQEKASISWSNQIRTYVFDQNRVKDHRYNIDNKELSKILSGDIDHFIYTALANWNRKEDESQ